MKPQLFFLFLCGSLFFQKREDEIANILLKKKIKSHLFVYRNLQNDAFYFLLFFITLMLQ